MVELSRQLFRVVRNVELPTHAFYERATKRYIRQVEVSPVVMAIYWPDGSPCVTAEQYLLDCMAVSTINSSYGGSLKAIAAKLSHLIRYCWSIKKPFDQLTEEDFDAFVSLLGEECDPDDLLEPKRSENTINAIIDQSIRFLAWLQVYSFSEKVFVGKRGSNSQIRLVEKEVSDGHGGRKVILTYPRRLSESIADPKHPMPTYIRNKLWEAVARLADPGNYDRRYMSRFKNDEELRKEFNYLKARRELLLILLEATGCRPEELEHLSVSSNANCSIENKIVLNTAKRRGNMTWIRRIPLDPGAAIKLQIFISKIRRVKLLDLKKRGVKIKPRNRVFLCSRKGTPLSAGTMGREFARIADEAQIDQDACAIMFRKRFITRMVRLHLEGFITDSGKAPSLMTNSDYRTILKKVTSFTGHKDVESLMYYIDLAWEEMGVFDYVKPAFEFISLVENSITNIESLSAEVRLSKRNTSLINMVTAELDGLKGRMKQALQAIHHRKSNATAPVGQL